eukprot:2781998-Rhodomonas_salina.1
MERQSIARTAILIPDDVGKARSKRTEDTQRPVAGNHAICVSAYAGCLGEKQARLFVRLRRSRPTHTVSGVVLWKKLKLVISFSSGSLEGQRTWHRLVKLQDMPGLDNLTARRARSSIALQNV